MNGFNRSLKIALQICLLFALVSPALHATNYSDLITEQYLRTQFTFQAGDTLKYAKCKKKSYLTCRYVWGAESKKDAIRIKYGQPPDGNKLQITYAQAKSQKDFQRVQSRYKDGVKVDAVGTDAIWSAKRSQLSLITKNKLIIHINIDAKASDHLKMKAVNVASHILAQL